MAVESLVSSITFFFCNSRGITEEEREELPLFHTTMGSVRISVTDNQLVRFLLLVCRCIQWPSAVIVLGITSSFIHSGPRGLLPTYTEIIVSIMAIAGLI